MKSRKIPSREYLNECFRYDVETGKLYWKERPREHFKTDQAFKALNTRYSGKEAFTSINSNGYKFGTLNLLNWQAHRIIYKLIFDEEPEQIDHINGIRTDNRICNLRSANNQENQKNTVKRIDNTSGTTGVYWSIKNNKWRCQINTRSGQKHLGYFKNLDEAIAIRKAAEIEYGYHENHGRS